MPIDFRVLVLDFRSYARSGGHPRLRLVGANIPVKEALREDRHVRLRGSEQRDSHYQGVAFGERCGYLRGARVARLGGPAVRRGFPLFLKRTPRVPDPGQPVDLRMEDGSWRRGFRAISEPSTTEWGEVAVWVATEDEYRAARGEGRSTVAYRADGHLFLWPPLATAPPRASTVPPGSGAPVVDREAFGRSRGR